MKIFISGSISIKQLPPLALEKINSIIEKNYRIIIGDAKGVDFLVQEYLLKNKYNDVTVYFTGDKIRNNAGDWETNQIIVDTEKIKGRQLYTVKDKAMANDADYGLMIWDGKSKGTLGNINEMKRLNKQFYVILNGKVVDDRYFNFEIKQKNIENELQPALL